jgi:pyruvate/2-oxoglutarate dehydrogenase complex dihydrolipoamide dehydrogenase (E3) component
MASVLGTGVTVIDARTEFLPFLDREIAARLRQHLTAGGVEVLLGEEIAGAGREGDQVRVRLKGIRRLACDRLLHSGHRIANTDG